VSEQTAQEIAEAYHKSQAALEGTGEQLVTSLIPVVVGAGVLVVWRRRAKKLRRRFAREVCEHSARCYGLFGACQDIAHCRWSDPASLELLKVTTEAPRPDDQAAEAAPEEPAGP
jgi:hypothetical protein